MSVEIPLRNWQSVWVNASKGWPSQPSDTFQFTSISDQQSSKSQWSPKESPCWWCLQAQL